MRFNIFSTILALSLVALCLGAYSHVEARNAGVDLIVTQGTARYLNDKIETSLVSNLTGIISQIQIINSRGSLSIDRSWIQFTPSGIRILLFMPRSDRRNRHRHSFRREIAVSLRGGIPTATLNEGKPDFNISACSVRSWGFGRRSVREQIRMGIVSVRDSICDLVRGVMNKLETDLESNYPASISIGEMLTLNFSLVRNPKFGRGFIQMTSVGLTSPLVSSDERDDLANQKYVVPWNRDRHRVGRGSRRSHRMLIFTFQTHTLNAALLAYHRANLFTQEFDLSAFDDSTQDILRVEDFELNNAGLCVNPSDCVVKVKVSALQAPNIRLWYGKVLMNGTAVLEVDLVNKNTSERTNLLKISVSGIVRGNLRIEQNENQLTAIARLINAWVRSVSVENSPFRNFSSSELNQMVKGITQQLIPKANTYLSSGVEIQQPTPFTIKSPLVYVYPRHLEVRANFAFNPRSEEVPEVEISPVN